MGTQIADGTERTEEFDGITLAELRHTRDLS